MALDSESEKLPPLYEGWINELLGAPIPRESRATCSSCVMQAGAGAKSENKRHYFDPVIKCCTYLPTLYNFLVGRALSDQEVVECRKICAALDDGIKVVAFCFRFRARLGPHGTSRARCPGFPGNWTTEEIVHPPLI